MTIFFLILFRISIYTVPSKHIPLKNVTLKQCRIHVDAKSVWVSYADPERLSEGVQLCSSDNVFFCFLVDEGREDPSTTKSGPSSGRQRNAI